MKILFLNEPRPDKIGGGLTFFRNLTRGLNELNIEYTHDIEDQWDVALVCGATMVKRSKFDKAKLMGKVVIRIDGVPEDWRNRGTGWSRLRDYARESHSVIYQSEFSKNTTGRLVGRKDGSVIPNGVDKSIFRPDGEKFPEFGSPSILYCNYRKGENNKRVEEAVERFRQFKIDNPKSTMTFVGNFSKKQFRWDEIDWDFSLLDMERGGDWQYVGIIGNREELAKIMRSCDKLAFPSFADPAPNTLIEALHCGLEPIWTCPYGSTDEIISLFKDGYDFSLSHMTELYVDFLSSLL
jgi:glycosyltransferase involved in cell wall biosynthesis